VKRFKKPKTVWLGRRIGGDCDGEYEIGLRKKSWDPVLGFPDSDFITGFCEEDFEHVTGICLEESEVVKVRFVVEEVK